MSDTLITLGEVKDFLNISGSTQYDTFISASIPVVTEFIESYTFNDFVSASFDNYRENFSVYNGLTYAKDYPVGLKFVAVDMIKYRLDKAYSDTPSNVASINIGSYGISNFSEYPKSILDQLKGYRRIKFV